MENTDVCKCGDLLISHNSVGVCLIPGCGCLKFEKEEYPVHVDA